MIPTAIMSSIVGVTIGGTVTCKCKFILYEIWIRWDETTRQCVIGFQKRTLQLLDPIK